MDLTAAQWEKLKPLLAPKRRSDGRGRPWRDTQAVLNGVLWVLRTGAPWHDLPDRYPPYQTCHRRFQQWQRDGTLDRLLHALAEDLRARGKLDLSETFIDASFSSAKKGALLSARLAEEKAVKSWRSQTAMVFLSPAASPALRLMKANSSKRPSRSVSREPNQIE
jgi:transposase